MGSYRLLLAIGVLLSHAGVNIGGRDQGVPAVISFLLLSGYVMTALLDKHYPAKSGIAAFYADRLMRLLPQYVFYIAATIVLILIAHPKSMFLEHVTPACVTWNLTLLPLNTQYLLNCRLIPQAWSLGMETQFYLVFPVLLAVRARGLAIAASGVVFLLAYKGVLDTNLYGYRLLPGTLFIFLLGSLLRRPSRYSHHALCAIYLGAAALFGLLYIQRSFDVIWNHEVLLGILVGVPMVAILSRMRLGSVDALLGNMSYGVFLNHYLVIWSLQSLGIEVKAIWQFALLLVASLALAWISYQIIERPAIDLRHRFRARADSGLVQPRDPEAPSSIATK